MELTRDEIRDALNITRMTLAKALNHLSSYTNKALVIDNALVVTTHDVLPIGHVVVKGNVCYLGYLVINNEVCNKFILSRNMVKPCSSLTANPQILEGVKLLTEDFLKTFIITIK